MASLSVESRCLYVPSLEELGQVLREGLDQNFAHVDVSVVSCPDLSQPPYHLAASGMYLYICVCMLSRDLNFGFGDF